MKIRIVKPHFKYSGIVDLPVEAANYLLRCGIAKKVDKTKKTKA